MKLMVIFGSSRQGRKGEVVANWVKNHAQQDSRLEVDYVDCRDLNLPFFDEPLSPFSMKRQGVEYTHPEGRAWADRVGKVDGAIIITPEYNHGYPAVLKNALDWVGPEWASFRWPTQSTSPSLSTPLMKMASRCAQTTMTS
jgi:NAD(P)H-dependent FMN reductase